MSKVFCLQSQPQFETPMMEHCWFNSIFNNSRGSLKAQTAFKINLQTNYFICFLSYWSLLLNTLQGVNSENVLSKIGGAFAISSIQQAGSSRKQNYPSAPLWALQEHVFLAMRKAGKCSILTEHLHRKTNSLRGFRKKHNEDKAFIQIQFHQNKSGYI